MYRLERTTTRNPAILLADAKAHLRVDHDTEDSLIESIVLAVQDMLEPPDGWLGRALARADYRLTLPGFADVIKLPAPPFVELKEFKYFDVDGDEQTVDSGVYRVVERDIAYIERISGQSWPTAESGRTDPVTVTYTAGYQEPVAAEGDQEAIAGDVPEAIQQWMLMQIAQFYDMRSAISPQQFHGTPFVRHMLESWRVRL